MPAPATTRREEPRAKEPTRRRPSERRRADAERNIAAIVEAGLATIDQHSDVSMAAIARAAGVSRVTLYAHFPSKESLVEAVLERAVAEADAVLGAEAVDRGPARDALARLVRTSWRNLERYGRLYAVATRCLTPQRMRERHGAVLGRVERLIARGQAEGAFRTDLPRAWLLTVFYNLMHVAAGEVDAGRLHQGEAAGVLETTLLAVLTAGAAGA
ncbi:MAG TPA: TetR/AcrR family transcriptional regulator [Chloroflexota bacterium]|nr:TetR/AcrR family transcriptional regulator [Chloroflexota bacterium]